MCICQFTKKATKELHKIHKLERLEILDFINKTLKINPKQNSKQLNSEDEIKSRSSSVGDYRIIFILDENNSLLITCIRHRKDVYRHFNR